MPDPRFLYMAPDHRETFAALKYGIRERRGFITIVGETGTGKTTLLNATLDRLDPNFKTAFIFNTSVTFEQLMNMVVHELGLAEYSEQFSKLDAIHRLNRFALRQLVRGGSVVLIIDEAQNLSRDALKDLCLLSNLETRKYKLVQIVLSGQPELDIKLARHDLRQLTQRISLKRHVTPLEENDTYAYLQHRLKRANYTGSSLFTRKAQRLIWEYSGGIPRKINMLCDNALLIAYGLKQKKIHDETIQEAIADFTWDGLTDTETPVDRVPPAQMSPRRLFKSRRRSFTWATALMLAGFSFFAGGFYLGRPALHSPGEADFLDPVKSRAAIARHAAGMTGSTQPDKPDPPKQQVIAQKTEAVAQLFPDGKPERYPIDPSEDLSPRDTVIAQKTDTNIEPSTVDNPQGHAIYQAADGFQTFPKTPVPGNAVASEIKLGSPLNEKETIINPSAQEQIIQPTGEIDANEPGIVSKPPVETDIINRQVKVQNGKTFYRIILERCGTYNDVIQARVLEENPDITDPSRIRAGQVITLPVSCVQTVD